MSDPASRDSFEQWSALSRALHGHRYVVAVARWIVEKDLTHIATRDAMEALGGRADRARALEALQKLCELGALAELPRDSRVNSAREFERRDDPYWSYVTAKLELSEAASSASEIEGQAGGLAREE